MTLQDTLSDDVVVRLVNRQDERNDTVAPVSGTQGVAVETSLVVGVTLELITCTFAHRMTDRVEDLVIDVHLDTEEAFLAVNGRIVAIETCGIDEFLLTVPAVGPDHRQVIVADVDDRIHHRMNAQLQHGRAVTSFRRTCIMRVGAGGRVGLAVELIRVTLQDTLADDAVVRLVNRQDERRDRVTTVGALRGVTIDTRFGEIHTDERIGRTLTDSRTDRVMNRFDDIELDTPEERFIVNHGLVMVQTSCLQVGGFTCPVVHPCERQVVCTYISDGVNQRMNN